MRAAEPVVASRASVGLLVLGGSLASALVIVWLRSFTLQMGIVIGAASIAATVLMSSTGRSLNAAWIVVLWLYLVGPVGAFILQGSTGLSPAVVFALAPAPFVAATLLTRPDTVRRLILVTPIVMLAAIAAASLAWSPAAQYGSAKLSVWVLTGILPLASILVLAPVPRGVAWWLIAVVALAAALGLLFFGTASSLYPGRPALFEANPIWAARAAFVGALVVCFGPFPAALKVILPPVMVAAGLVTVSLGPALGFVSGAWAGIVTVIATSRWTRRRRAYAWLALAVATLAALAVLTVGAIVPETAGLRRLLLDDPNVVGRAVYLAASVELFVQAPLTGIGFGGFASTGMDVYPHNLVAEIALELGTFGLLLFGLWCVLAVRGALGSPILTALFVGSSTFALFSGSAAGNSEFWLFSGLAVAQLLPVGANRPDPAGTA